jgi:hypothetical protein
MASGRAGSRPGCRIAVARLGWPASRSAPTGCDQGRWAGCRRGLVRALGVPGPPADAPGRSLGLEILWVRIPDDGQDEAVFEQDLQGAQDDGEAAGGVGDAGQDLIAITAEAGLGDLDVGGAVPQGVKRNSTVVALSSPHSKRIRRSAWTSLTETLVETPYISQSHRRSAPAVILPLLLVNQNLVVMAGSTKAWKASWGGLRTSIPTCTVGIWVSWSASADMIMPLSAGALLVTPCEGGCNVTVADYSPGVRCPGRRRGCCRFRAGS